MTKLDPIFTWDEEVGYANCTLTDAKTGKTYVGTAACHPDDSDMMSEKTGCELAYRRARINALRGHRDELKCELNALNRLYYNMKHSTRFNPCGYENIMLQRHIRMTENDLATAKDIIATELQNLYEIIDEKEKFYTRVRLRRMAKAQQSLFFES